MKNTRLWVGSRTDVGFDPRPVGAGLFAVIAVLIGVDLIDDSRSGVDLSHLLFEGVIMTLALAGVATLWRQLWATRRHAARLSADLEAASREAQQFHDEARETLRGLGDAIDRQFGQWGLTPAESQIGWLLLKGLSHKEIAETRSTSETTIRQQALAVYRKSRLRNRAELSAFFLEDLFAAR